jgi:hypothetical protein
MNCCKKNLNYRFEEAVLTTVQEDTDCEESKTQQE